ncbi:hypothetical protein [Mameliella sediminis]|nr:hypothetical protein [Mameliella sediminis]MBY6113681.1 hypothetical protein [Antarctobacter heliothermus]MBY6142971.1 hypothetical protein [Mameliella alba]MBV7394978.1 hypothetical protein [Mameliella sediminis]MBY6159826.1 hypothetical protein [Mameliella alba]MBY6168297.1 hypothetical protein [Mameliella alba]
MFRLFRSLFLLLIAFLAGFLYSEMTWHDRCVEKGGEARGGLCFGVSR